VKYSTIDYQDFSDKERDIINKILSMYDFNVVSFEKVRSVYKVNTTQGNICLKKLVHGKNKAENGSILVEELYNNNFFSTPKYIRTKSNNLFVKYKKVFFYATEWINGNECNLDNIEEVVNCTELLAKFHIATNEINSKKLRIKNNLKNWPKVYKDMMYELYKFEKIIDNKKIKGNFDIEYKSNIDYFFNKAMFSLKILNESEYFRLSENASKNHTICHDSFYYQNIIKKGEDYYIIDLDSIMIDLQVNDLGKFIRRLMSKKIYSWSFEKTKSIIEAYDAINKLTKEHLEVMLALIIFPHKFWKLGRKRYVKHKNWNEQKYSHKLKKILTESTLQQNFIEEYIKYVTEYI
jgi:CotS family spore coat protein